MEAILIIITTMAIIIAVYQWIKRLTIEEQFLNLNEDVDQVAHAVIESETSENISGYQPRDIRMQRIYNNYIGFFLDCKLVHDKKEWSQKFIKSIIQSKFIKDGSNN